MPVLGLLDDLSPIGTIEKECLMANTYINILIHTVVLIKNICGDKD